MARAAAYLYGAGSLLALLSLALPGVEGRHMLGILGVSAAGLLCGVVHLTVFNRLPVWAFQASGVVCSALITGGILMGGASGSAFPLFFFWVVLYAFFFYGFAGASFQLAVVAGAYSLVLALPGSHGLGPVHAALTLGTLATAGVAVLVIKRRLLKLLDGIVASQAALGQSEEKYRDLVEQLPLATYIDSLDEVSSAIYMSPQIEGLLGYTVDEWLADPELWVKVLHPEDRERVLAVHQDALASGSTFSCEYRLVARDGRAVWFRDEAVPVYDPTGRPLCARGYLLDITEARKADDALRTSEERYRTLVSNVPGAIFRCACDSDWTMEFLSDQMEKICGYPASDFIDNRVRSFASIVHPDENQVISDIVGDGDPYEVEYRIIHADGSIRWVFERGRGVRDDEGVMWLEGAIFDITERREAQELLHEAEVRNRTLVEQLPLVTFVSAVEPKTSIVYISPQVEEMLGVRPEEWEEDPEFFWTFVHPEDRDLLLDGVTRLRETGEPMHCEYRLVARDGRVVWVQDESLLVRDASGEPQWVQGYLLDVTERHVAEENLRQAKEYSETLIRTANVMIVGLDEEGCVRVFNEAAEKITGYTHEEVEGRDWFELVAPRSRYPELWEEFAGWATGAALPETFEGPILTKSGEERHVSWRNSEVRDGSRATGTIAFGIDVTERKDLEDQLRHSQKMEAIGRLAGGIAHDFNNLLTAIAGYSDFALESLDDKSAAALDIGEVRKAADRASSLTRQLLAFSRRQVLRPEVLSLNEVVSDMEAMLRRLIGENIRLAVTLDPTLQLVQLDRGQIEQVLMNLALNARDAMGGGGDLILTTKNVELDATRADSHGLGPGSYVMLVVSDTGCGMDAETRSRAFEPFFTTKEHGKGTGLGLATVYGIVKQSGGSILLDSTVDKGTVFTILLPRAWEGAKTVKPTGSGSDRLEGSETILLVEDEDIVRDLVRKMLEQAGYEILVASDGRQALALSKEHEASIDLLLTDVIMPGMNGRELAERLWFSRPEMKVLYMSGYTDSRVFDPEMLDTGSAFLHKPFTMTDLTGKVREVMDAPRAGMAA